MGKNLRVRFEVRFKDRLLPQTVVWFIGAALVAGFSGCGSEQMARAILANEARDYELAIRYAKEVIASDPNNAGAYFQIGYAYSMLDSVGLAYKNLSKSAELDPSSRSREQVERHIQLNVERHYNAGLAASKQGNHKLAIGEQKKAAKADPRRWRSYYQLGESYVAMGNEDEAWKAFQKALDNANSEDYSLITQAMAPLGEALAREDIAGFEDFEWGMSYHDAHKLVDGLAGTTYKQPEKKLTELTVYDFPFQSKLAGLVMRFHNDQLYSATVSYEVGRDEEGINEYFATAEQLQDVYGPAIRIALGRESSDFSYRVTQIAIGELSYQHKWMASSGRLVYQLSANDVGRFVCAFFYRSATAEATEGAVVE